MDKRLVGALLQFGLLAVGIPVAYLVVLRNGFGLPAFLPPLGLLVGLTVGGYMVKKTEQPVSGPLTGWAIFIASVGLAFVLA